MLNFNVGRKKVAFEKNVGTFGFFDSFRFRITKLKRKQKEIYLVVVFKNQRTTFDQDEASFKVIPLVQGIPSIIFI